MRTCLKSNIEGAFSHLATCLFDLVDLSADLKIQDPALDIEESAKIEMQRMQIDRFCEDIVTQISLDARNLLKFAYALRMEDGEDKYSYDLLNG